ncbi:GNAT family N-acetyltransferase [Demequina sp. TTPB684]|uniref:GNAT family N-acetyltransferase n=1 Tax=unclassified Demequina TaxID=2620311 RepID=UPI001CF142A3|nr:MULTISPECIES: GNAT family N-acetyltransferase [unclassified Demequina]MCB2412297.1 GNAT family N-acetyltransferase [Demequina sp. TTPB684]UPU87577.1 GNAT family N-acetyltransferase [Demequina sp. TMPB413]
MPITLRPMSADHLPQWLATSNAQYIDELVAGGRTREDATHHAAKFIDPAFPDGRPAHGYAVFDVLNEAGAVVGYLWVGPDTSDDPAAWWVWDIEIDATQRGHGYGRTAMLLGEEYAYEHGARTLGLNVVGSNAVARGLYESLDYEATAVQMRKRLGPAPQEG